MSWATIMTKCNCDMCNESENEGEVMEINWQPCPFCGEVQELEIGEDVSEFSNHSEYFVRCCNCGSRGPENSVSPNKAIELWNERSANAKG